MQTPSRFHGPAARALREAHKIRQVELARRVGITRAALANIEAGRRQPNPATAQTIAEHLDCDLAAITYPTAAGAA